MKKSIFLRIGFWLLVALVVIFSLFPFYYAILTSFKSGTDIFRISYIIDTFDLSNYKSVFAGSSFGLNILNSLLVASSVVVLSLFLSVTAAFALSRVRFHGRGTLLAVVLSVSMFPQIAVLAGLFEVINMLGIYNKLPALIFSYMIFTLPFTVWILTTFMKEIHIEMEEAAIIDGAGPWVIITKIFMPLMWPALATTGLLAFIAAWNEFLFALTFTIQDETRTVPVAIAQLSGASEREIPWGNIMAASVIVTVPLVILVLIFQRKIVSGLTAGAVKG